MAVNENVYGAPNTWVNAYYQQNTIVNKNKIANFGDNTYTLAQGVSKSKLSYDEGIDKSISFCGLGTECALSNIAFIARTSSNTAEVLTENERVVTNFGFFERVDNSMTTSATDFRTNEKEKYAWGNYSNLDNFTKTLRPLTVVNPHNLVLCIYVRCSEANYNNVQSMTLKSYLQSYTQSRPRIYKVWVQPYFGDTIPRLTDAGQGSPEYRKPLQIGILDEYEFTAKDLNFNSYQLQSNNVVFGSFSFGDYFYNIPESFAVVAYTPNSREHLKIEYISGSDTYFPYFEYYNGFEEDILKTVACFGLYFTTDNNVAQSGALTHNDMYIGILDADGIGHGNYLKGTNTANAPQNNWNDMSDSGYDYTKDVDKTKYRNDTQFYAGYGTSSFTKFYALTETQVNQLSQELYRIANDVPSGTSITEYNMKMFLTNNPIDCIISLKKFPVENIPLASSDATIYLGAKATNITGKILATPTWVYYFNFRNSADQSCRPIFGNNFLDYEPYTKCKINIPFCGTVDVPVSYIYQYDDLQIALVVDFITGAVTAFIKVNGITIDSITGSCAIDLPVSGIQSATLDSQIHSVAMAREKQQTTLGTGLIAGAVSIGIGLATGNLPVAIGGGAAIIGSFMHAEDTGKQINYDLTHMQTPVKQVSAASGQIAHTYDMRCKMIITRPEIAAEYSAEEYSKTIGFACLENGEVQNFHGLTLANIDLSGINCTAEEKNMIRAAFANGVYLPAEYSENYWT